MFKNGKLFGKINVIDLLVILVIVAAIAAGAVFLFYKPQQNTDTLIMKYRIEEVDDFVADKVEAGYAAAVEEEEGFALYDDSYMVELGFATAIERGPSISYGSSTDGVYTLGSKEGYSSLVITGEVEGKKTDLGCEVAGKKYGVGHSFVLRAGDAKLYLRVYDIALKDEDSDGEDVNAAEKTEQIPVTLYAEDVEDYVFENIEKGDTVKNILGNEIGVVETLEAAPSDTKIYVETEDGLVPASREGHSDVTLECTMEGTLSEDGIRIDDRLYGVGDAFEIRVGYARMTAKVGMIG